MTSSDCLVPTELGVPQSVNVNISRIGTSQAAREVPDASKRSTSPWDYSINEDPNRIPPMISEAKCRHSGCVDALGRENHSMSSVPILQEILVLRRQHRGCKQTYWLEKQWITVGCTCARPRSTPL
uniref:interleukin-17A-like n=1 Tax=Euleptes europaea TaxID=460621 RepID=UPI0025406769|nr:interleukin-17A-like [Euleptes europaea]